MSCRDGRNSRCKP